MSKVSDEQIKFDRLVSNLHPRDILDLIGTFIFEMNKNVADFESGLNKLMEKVHAKEEDSDLPM